MNKGRLSLTQLVEGIRNADRMVLAKAITLVESTRDEDIRLATELVDSLPRHDNTLRIGITGVPGVGKSTFIEVFGERVIQSGKKIAVLTVDPSSQHTKGSILGDKTRMESLSKNPNAFIRPSASGSVLGGVAGKTREAMLLCEAAGFDVILVETVGVGQSEVEVKNMVDFFLLLMLAGAGDELQGIKKGIMEMADAIVITKADGDNRTKATEAQAEYQHAIHLFAPKGSGWAPPVMTCSAYDKSGMKEIWTKIQEFETKMRGSGYFVHQRHQQNERWFHEYFQLLLKSEIDHDEDLQALSQALDRSVREQAMSPFKAASKLLEAYHRRIKDR